MQTLNARLLLAGVLALVAVSCVGAVVWWLTAGEPLSAQEQVADAAPTRNQSNTSISPSIGTTPKEI